MKASTISMSKKGKGKKKHGQPRSVLNQTWNGHIFSWQQIGGRWRIVTDAPALVARQFLAACTG